MYDIPLTFTLESAPGFIRGDTSHYDYVVEQGCNFPLKNLSVRNCVATFLLVDDLNLRGGGNCS